MCFFGLIKSYFNRNNNHSMQLGSTGYDPRIIIIGAGAAGLACAMKLLEYGFDNIVILEAENRIGGRILTQPFADNVVDLGAQWVHGENNNVVFNMVKGNDWLSTTGEIYVTYECIRSNGAVVSPKVVDRLKRLLTKVYFCESLNAYQGSFGAYLWEHFSKALEGPDMKDIDRDVAWEFFENFKRIESSETASVLEDVSASGMKEYWQCAGDYLLNWKNKGFIRYLHMLIAANEDEVLGKLEDVIRFECVVQHIKWNRADKKAIVVCDNGKLSLEADHVIITVSLGVLKAQIDSMFSPPLPIQKKSAIVGLGYGSVGKIYLEFPTKFWPDKWYGFTTLWRQSDLSDLRNSTIDWVEEVFGFFCVNYQPRVLTAWVVGPYVQKVENMSEESLKEGCMYVLNRFLKTWQIPEPLNIQVSKWQTNPNFLGAYSFRSMLSEQLNAWAGQLAQPLMIAADGADGEAFSVSRSDETTQSVKVKPICLFAGEATSPHYFSTVHGAVESGQREARRLLNFYWDSTV